MSNRLALPLLLLLPGCAWLAGARPAVSLESDRRLVADARARTELVATAAEAAGNSTTAQVLTGAAESLRTLQAGPLGTVEVAPWPSGVVDAINREQSGTVTVEERLVQDPALKAALEAKEEERARADAESRDAHGQAQAWQAKARELAVEAAGKWGLGTVATGGGGLLVGLLGLAWKNRKKAAAVYAAVRALQDVKHAAEAGQEIDVPAAIQFHAGANGARAEIEEAYRRAKGRPKPPGRARRAAVAVARSTVAGMKKAKAVSAAALARLRRPAGEKKPKSKD